MQEFKTITEHQILSITMIELLGRYQKEREFEKNGSKIAKERVDILSGQIAEINKRILEIEGKA